MCSVSSVFVFAGVVVLSTVVLSFCIVASFGDDNGDVEVVVVVVVVDEDDDDDDVGVVVDSFIVSTPFCINSSFIYMLCCLSDSTV